MNIRTLTLCLILIIFHLSCQTDPSTKTPIKEISTLEALNNTIINPKLSDFAEQVKYIKLETSPDCIIDDVRKLLLKDSFIYIGNRSQVFKFDINGNFLTKFGAKGKGPGEYLQINDFAVSPTNKDVSIYDIDQRKVIQYESDGTFINEFILPSMPSLITYDKNNNLKLAWTLPDFSLNDQYGINTYTSKGELVNQFFDRSNEGISRSDAYTIPSTSLSRFQILNDSLTFWEINYPYVCRVFENKIEPIYHVNLGYSVDKTELNDTQIEEDEYIYSDLIETSRYIFLLKGLFKNEVFHIIYDKSHETINSFKISHESPAVQINKGFINDIDGGYPFLPSGIISKDELYTTFFAYEFAKIKDEAPFNEIGSPNESLKNKFDQIMESSSIEDNPIVMIVKFKSI